MSNNVSYHQAFDFDSGKVFDEDEDKCIPRFHLVDSMREGELVKIEMVEINTPGDRFSKPVQKVTDVHRKRWPRAYAAFKSGINPGIPGSPIATWSEASWNLQASMQALGFQTIEQLADAHDGQLDELPNGMFWRKKAQAYVTRNKSIVNKDGEIDALRKQLAELTALVKGQTSNVLPQSKPGDGGDGVSAKSGQNAGDAPRRGPGRPRKAKPVAGVPGEASANQSAA